MTCFHRFSRSQVTAWMLCFSESQALIVEDLNQSTQKFTGKKTYKSTAFTCSTLILDGLSHPTSKMDKLLCHRTAKKYCRKFPKRSIVWFSNVLLICFPEENILSVTLKNSVKCLHICTDKTGGILL